MQKIECFMPVVGCAPKVLILGTMPSVKSLEYSEYYGHDRNQFWRIMGDLFGFERDDHYELRKRMITDQGIALWDVISSCERQGSLDKDIKNAAYNDIVTFVKKYPTISAVVLNGTKARDIYRKQFEGYLTQINAISYYSTSPANAIAYERKLLQWQGLLDLIK